MNLPLILCVTVLGAVSVTARSLVDGKYII